MEEEKLMEDEAKKQKERNNEVGGQNFGPHTLKLSQSWVNPKKKKQNKKNLFQSFKYLSKSKFSNKKFSFPSF